MTITESTMDQDLKAVRGIIMDALRETSLREEVDRFGPTVIGGKMLRASLVLAVGERSTVPHDALCRLGAAIELLHAASLLHDDIIDGGIERRRAAALWVSDGTKAAVLVGDLLLSIALGLVHDSAPERLPSLVKALHEMCDGEAEQEFRSGAELHSWKGCMRIARRKTGSLFGLAAACAGGADAALAAALERAGSDLGTAYQLADDMLDICDESALAGKSLGTDARSGKLTAATASVAAGVDPDTAINELLVSAERELNDWPTVQQQWNGYVDGVIRPLVEHFTGIARMETV